MADISRRDFGKSFASGIGLVMLGSNGVFSFSSESHASAQTRPNFVFICSDQHNPHHTGYMGHPIVRTQNLDKIAGEGVVFTDCYCSSPICAPSRAGMMTGMYPSDNRSYCNATVWDGTFPTWPKRLEDAGYHCWAAGKLDLNDSFDMGFAEEIETTNLHRHTPSVAPLFRRPLCYEERFRDSIDGKARATPHSDQEIADHAVRFLRKEAPKLNQPWLMYVGFNLPHPPFTAMEKYFELYSGGEIDMPAAEALKLEKQPLVIQELRHFNRLATLVPNRRISRARAAYYGRVTELDTYIGRIWKELEKTGLLSNTIFLYTSDHGESLGDHGLWGKGHLYDVAARVPLVVAGRGIPKGVRVKAPVGHVDLAPTLLKWAGTARPTELRGHSLIPLMKGKQGDHPGFAYCECHCEGNCTGSFMVQKGGWKYVHFSYYGDFLWRLEDDPYPSEIRNRIDDPEAQDVRAELQGILRGLVDPEEITIRAFKAQEAKLQEYAQMEEAALLEVFRKPLGEGQARVLVNKIKGR